MKKEQTIWVKNNKIAFEKNYFIINEHNSNGHRSAIIKNNGKIQWDGVINYWEGDPPNPNQ